MTLGLLIASFVVERTVNEKQETVIVNLGITQSKFESNQLLPLIEKPWDSLHFCNEQIPLSPRIEKIIAKQEKRFFYLKRKKHRIVRSAKKWFPLIEPILAEYGIPEDFKYFTIVESNLSNVKSSQGAVGFWQLIPGTARSLGLIVTDEVDERYDPIKSTYAACKYLKQSYKRLGNWSNVAASYNMGISGLHRQLRRQKKDSYYDLVLNRETALYVYKGIAVKKLVEKRGKYSYLLSKKIEEKLTKKVIVSETIEDLEAFATNHHIDYKTLQKYNPWIRSKQLTFDSLQQYTLKIPLQEIQNTILASN